MSTVKWSPYGTYTAAIAGASLQNLATATAVLGSAIDNTSNLYVYSDWDLTCKFQASPTAGSTVDLYLLPSLDGTNYADGSASVTPSRTLLVGTFPVQPNTTAQRIAVRGVMLSPGKVKPLVINNAGQSMTNNSTDNVLSYVAYSETVV